MKLADKLYAMTEVEGLGPQNTAEERVVKMKAIMTQVALDSSRSHLSRLVTGARALAVAWT